jgi:hypothetical protein
LNQISQEPHPASDAIENALPLKAVRQFDCAGIASQQLMDEGIVLAIVVNLQLIE